MGESKPESREWYAGPYHISYFPDNYKTRRWVLTIHGRKHTFTHYGLVADFLREQANVLLATINDMNLYQEVQKSKGS